MSKTVIKSVESQEQAEGKGARVRRSVGRPELKNLDPFLMLDEFNVQGPAGFPDHPHRGFETVTYMMKGKFRHEDFCGHTGVINSGDLQWMTAGRGIVHCEMPCGDEPNVGLQLWVNLAAKDKMITPQYQELLAKDIPSVEKDGIRVKVIAGESMGTKMEDWVRRRVVVQYLFNNRPESISRLLFVDGQRYIWMIEALSHLVAASYCEDRFGIVQKSLPDILTIFLSLLEVVDRHLKVCPVALRKSRTSSGPDVEYMLVFALRSTIRESLYRIVATFNQHLGSISLNAEHRRRLATFIEYKD